VIQTIAADSLRAVLRGVFAQSAYDWRERPGPLDFLRRWWDALTARLAALEASHPGVLRWIVWGLVVVLAAIAAHAVWLLIRTTRRPPVDSTIAPVPGATRRWDADWFRAEAERLARAGSFAAAVQADFIRLVLELDRLTVVQFHPSKTPREYLPEVAGPPERRRDFAALIADLYRYAFAGHSCGPDQFAAWRARADADRYAPAH
jgi:hypothetical protein